MKRNKKIVLGLAAALFAGAVYADTCSLPDWLCELYYGPAMCLECNQM